MMSATFEKVESEDPDRVTLELYERAGQAFGSVYGPVAQAGNMIERPTFGTDRAVSATEAVAHAGYMSAGTGRPVAVIDPDGVWKSEWGALTS